MADVVKNEVIRLADIELETAIERFGLNHSNHESFAVLREEIDEATEETNNVNYLSTRVWDLTKKNASPEILRETYTNLYNAAIDLATEAIQCAAMARKGIMSNIEIYKEDNKRNALEAAKCEKCEKGLSAECVVDGCKHEERGEGE